MKELLKETVYTSASGIGNPFKLGKQIFSDLRGAHALGLRLTKRNIKAMYRQSLLGYVWSVVPPVLTALLWVFLNSQNVVNITVTDVPYPLFVIIGTLLWQIFSKSVNAPLQGVASGKAMLAKINFPREALILTGIYEVLFNACINVLLIIIVFAFYGFLPGFTFIYGLVGILALILFGSMIGLLLTPLGMLYSDVGKGIGLFLQFGLYLTPVIYPEPQAGIAADLMKLNPLAPLITTTRYLLLDNPAPRLSDFISISIISFVLFFFGLLIFRVAMPIVIERVGS